MAERTKKLQPRARRSGATGVTSAVAADAAAGASGQRQRERGRSGGGGDPLTISVTDPRLSLLSQFTGRQHDHSSGRCSHRCTPKRLVAGKKLRAQILSRGPNLKYFQR